MVRSRYLGPGTNRKTPAEDVGAIDILVLDELGTTADDVGAIDMLALDEPATISDDVGAIDILALDEPGTTVDDEGAIDKISTRRTTQPTAEMIAKGFCPLDIRNPAEDDGAIWDDMPLGGPQSFSKRILARASH
ncbi:MAG: hypothetical protein H0A75_07600 [Candidatus Methanofishera endochildressiae]|uniref:Uncharacterized protein n=1 Tax=Candidatus Methanofishera endochildressiae TaxID=2738884 RepID=A0A7Z0MQD1_9GAMM|nr:hypothetical protein [Candidatus Methanofishera endochildressiae]